MDKITDMAAWKASHVKPIAWQRVALRSIWRLYPWGKR